MTPLFLRALLSLSFVSGQASQAPDGSAGSEAVPDPEDDAEWQAPPPPDPPTSVVKEYERQRSRGAKQSDTGGTDRAATGLGIAGGSFLALGVVGAIMAGISAKRGQDASARLDAASTPRTPPEDRVQPLADIKSANTQILAWSITAGVAATLGVGLIIGAKVKANKNRKRATAQLVPSAGGVACIVRF